MQLPPPKTCPEEAALETPAHPLALEPGCIAYPVSPGVPGPRGGYHSKKKCSCFGDRASGREDGAETQMAKRSWALPYHPVVKHFHSLQGQETLILPWRGVIGKRMSSKSQACAGKPGIRGNTYEAASFPTGAASVHPKCTRNAYGKAGFGQARLDGTLAFMHEPPLLQRGYLGSAQPQKGSAGWRWCSEMEPPFSVAVGLALLRLSLFFSMLLEEQLLLWV